MPRHKVLGPVVHMNGVWSWEVEVPEQRSIIGQAVVEWQHLLTSGVGGPSNSASDGRLEEIIENEIHHE